MKKFLKWSAISLFSVVLLVASSVAVAWRFPGLWLKPKVVLWAAHTFVPDLNIRAEITEIHADWVSLKKKDFTLKASNVCVDLGTPENTVCAKTVDIKGLVDLEATYYARNASVKVFGADVFLPSVNWKGNAVVDADDDFLKLVADGVSNQKQQAQVTLQLDPKKPADWSDFTFQIYAKGSLDKAKLHAQWTGAHSPGHWEGKGTLGYADKVLKAQGLKSLTAEACSLTYDDESKTKSRAKAICPIIVEGSLCNTKDPLCQELNRKTKGTVTADVNLKSNDEGFETIDGSVGIDIKSFLKNASLSLTTKIGGKITDLPEHLEFNTEGTLKVADFKALVELLRGSPYSVPAPINDLGGTMELHAQAMGRLLENRGKLPITLTTRLNSPHQTLNIDAKGEVTLKSEKGARAAHLDADLVLSQVRLELPQLSISRTPTILPDARMEVPAKRELAKKTEESVFTYEVRIRTEDKPVMLKTNLATEEVPLNVNLVLNQAGTPVGKISFGKFGVEMLRRKATVSNFDIGLHKDPRFNDLSGEVIVKQTDYTIWISFRGLLDEPQIDYRSEPPLPKDQVLAVLITGKPLDDLSGDETATVGQTKAAIQEKAIGVGSMFLLASTPVESVSYNPLSKVFTAKVRLADGTSLTVGSDVEHLSQLGVRHRLSKHWWVNTFINNPLVSESRSLSAILEWATQY